MTQDEYKARKQALKTEFDAKERELIIECAMSNVVFAKGDIIDNDIYTILIDKITTYRGLGDIPMPAYHGIQVKKDLQTRKDGNRGSIYGNDRVKLLKAHGQD